MHKIFQSAPSFGECWQGILKITPGTTIEARGVRGPAHGQFQITAITYDFIRVRSEALGSRKIPRSEFEAVFQRLQGRLNGTLDLSSTSPHSEYVLGVLHYVRVRTSASEEL
jgi:hypothetical protein